MPDDAAPYHQIRASIIANLARYGGEPHNLPVASRPRPSRPGQCSVGSPTASLASLQTLAERLEAECLVVLRDLWATSRASVDEYQVVQSVLRASHDSRVALGQMVDRAKGEAAARAGQPEDDGSDDSAEFVAVGSMTELPWARRADIGREINHLDAER